MSHIVSIVGRPNVGKSTLFNRILGWQQAIVHDRPGVTRDRLYASTDWAGKSFTLIDTGGFVPQSEDVFEQAIREQAEISIQEAEVVVFLVDATAGVLPLDEEIAEILRKSRKKILLVVNKVDNEQRESYAAQCYALGFGDPITLSALGGRKIGDFLDVLTESFSAGPEERTDDRLRLAIVGRPNVGKSSLVNAMLGKRRTIVTDIPGTTRDSIDSVLKYHQEEIVLVDTAGLRRKSKIQESVEYYSVIRTLKSIDQCDVAVLVTDAEQGFDKQDLKILERIVECRRGALIAVNKWDLIEKDEKTARQYERAIHTYLRTYEYVPVMFISALEKLRVFKVIEMAKKIFVEQSKRVPTSTLNKILLREIQSSPPSSKSGKEIKINYITQVKTRPPTFSFFANEPEMIEENYKRFLERTLREHFGFEGVPVSFHFRRKNR